MKSEEKSLVASMDEDGNVEVERCFLLYYNYHSIIPRPETAEINWEQWQRSKKVSDDIFSALAERFGSFSFAPFGSHNDAFFISTRESITQIREYIQSLVPQQDGYLLIQITPPWTGRVTGQDAGWLTEHFSEADHPTPD